MFKKKKKKDRGGKAYVYQMLLSFKTQVTYIFFLTSCRIIVPFVKQPSLDIARFFAECCPMAGANIQA